MGSRRALAVLAGLAALLVVAVIIDLGQWWPGQEPARAPATRRLLPGCGVVQRIAWHRPGEPVVSIAREADRGMVLAGIDGLVDGLVDQAVVADVLGTLELISYRRKLPADRRARGLDEPRVRLEITCEHGGVVTLALGHLIEQVDRVWLARGGDPGAGGALPAGDPAENPADYLIDGYVARALDRSPAELRARRVFPLLGALGGRMSDPFVAGVARIEIQRGARTRVLSGSPPMVHLAQRPARAPGGIAGALATGNVRADPAMVARLGDRLRDLSIVHFVDAAPRAPAPAGAGSGLRVRVHGQGEAAGVVQELAWHGPCPGEPTMRLVSTAVGTGCVDAGALDAVAAFVGEAMVSRHLVHPAARLAEIHITPAEAPAVTLVARGSAWHLRLAASAAAAADTAEVGAVYGWLAALTRAAGGALIPADEARPGARVLAVTFTHADGRTEELALFRPERGNTWLARRNHEPVFLALDPAVVLGARGILPAGPARFRRRQVLALEPHALREAVARRGGRVVEHLVRGELLSDWDVRVPAGKRLRAGAIEAIREAAGRLRARRYLAPEPERHGARQPWRRQVEVVFDPAPVDTEPAPRRHRIDIGARTEAGCRARLDQEPTLIELDRASCDALLGPWTR